MLGSCKERIGRLHERMKEDAVDLAVFSDADSIVYFSGFANFLAMEFGRATVLAAKCGEAPILITPAAEAEMARELVGMDRYSLIGLGSVRWLAGQTGGSVDRFVKPSPVQALAAIAAAAGAAACGRESAALQAGYSLAVEGTLLPALSHLATTTVHVFEDTVGGIGAVERAVELLREAGCAAECRAYGIVAGPGTKSVRMAEHGIRQFKTVNEALRAFQSQTH